ncbi:NADP-dependent oxidoreductase [Actinoplanes sp. NPDC026619]|uniref:NADP-dependent oxidoreductase n=1 Tax=Actinoplanes sp. NPDC026619 TaxID=3155798 RepID=UPI0034073F42
MRAIVVAEPGGSPALTELPEPTPRDGDVLVKVVASSLNGFDTAVAAGYLAGMMEHRYPVVLGKDFAGTVAAVGAGVTRFAVGDRVFGVVTKPYLGDGGFGEYVVVGDQIGIAAIPDGLDPSVAGVLGLAGTAAVDALDAVAVRPGETVLVSGATGGVGAIAIQYAAAAGARVLATARPGAEADLVTSLGASDVVDHAGDLAAQVRAISPDGVDVVLHLAGDGAALLDLLAEKGRLASTLGLGPDQHPAAAAVMATPTRATLDRLAADAAAGKITVPVARTYPLSEVPAAFGDFAGGTLGKLAVTID